MKPVLVTDNTRCWVVVVKGGRGGEVGGGGWGGGVSGGGGEATKNMSSICRSCVKGESCVKCQYSP